MNNSEKMNLITDFLNRNSNHCALPDIEKTLIYEQYLEILQRFYVPAEKLFVTFCGCFNTGKSTLINRLLNADILPTKITTATAVITYIEYGENEEVYVEIGGKRKKVTYDEARKAILYDDSRMVKEYGATKVYFYLPRPILKNGVVFVDTPGIDDEDVLTEISIEEAQRSSLGIIVFTAERFNKMADKALCKRLNDALGGNIAFVVNKCDLVNTQQGFQQLLEYEKATLNGFGNDIAGKGQIFNVSCNERGAADFDGVDKWLCTLIVNKSKDLIKNSVNARNLHTAKALLDILTINIDEMRKRFEKAVRELESETQNTRFEQARVSAVMRENLSLLRPAYNENMASECESLRSSYFEELYKIWKEKNLYELEISKYQKSTKETMEKEFGLWVEGARQKIVEVCGLTDKNTFSSYTDLGGVFDSLTFPDLYNVIWKSNEALAWVAGAGGALLGFLFGGIGAGVAGVTAYKAAKSAITKDTERVLNNDYVNLSVNFTREHVLPMARLKMGELFDAADKIIPDESMVTASDGKKNAVMEIKSNLDMLMNTKKWLEAIARG